MYVVGEREFEYGENLDGRRRKKLNI